MLELVGVSFHQAEFHAVLNASEGVQRELERQAERVVGVTQQNLSVAYPPPGRIGGPPARRTGDLQRSVHVIDGNEEDGLPTVEIVADAVHRNGPYAQVLLQRGYVFVSEADLAGLHGTG